MLASASPQRRAILERLGVAFEVEPAGVEELDEGDPEVAALRNATAKARVVAERVAKARPVAAGHAGALVLGADTVVALGDRILPKPRDPAEAREWLGVLSGRTHHVVGGLCVVEGEVERSATAITEVDFRALSDREIEWYVAAGEWRERAGGYAIQARGAALVRGIRGDYLNVVGLPVPTLLELVPDLLA